MKQRIKKTLISTILMIAIMNSTTVFASQIIPVYFDSQPMNLSENPIIENGTTLVPFRSIFEALGFNVEWDATTQTVRGYNDEVDILLELGNTLATVNGESNQLLVAPKIVNGNTMVPLRFVSEAAGYSVSWNSDNHYITVGENDQELVDIYELSSSIHLSDAKSGLLRFNDLYIMEGTGKYAGYKKLMGHPYTGSDIYYKGNRNSYQVITDTYFNPNDIVYWEYNGVTYKNYKKEIFDYLNNVSSLSGISDYINSNELKQIFGTAYDEWFHMELVSTNAGMIVDKYLSYLDGSTFNHYYSIYLRDLEFEEASKQFEEEQKAIEADRLRKEAEEDAYEAKELAVYRQYNSEWISQRNLKQFYNVAATWMGEQIIITTDDDEKYTIKGSPTTKFKPGKIYEGNNIRYQYIETIDYPFPEAKDGSGKLTIKVNDIVFSTEDLVDLGIIDQ